MAKRLVAMLMAAALTLSLAACGNGGSSSSTADSSTSSESSASDSAAADSSDASSEAEDLKESELVTLNIVTMSGGKDHRPIRCHQPHATSPAGKQWTRSSKRSST